MLTYLAIAQRYRPRWVVWENVPGVLSSGGGRDFGTFLGALGELGYGWAYRVLDAQWFGVAQRRRRVFVVGYLGDWQRAAQVLFERESVRRDTPPSREAREGSPFSTPRGIEVSCYERHDQDGRVKEIDVFPTLHSKSDNTCDLPIVMERPWESLCPQCAGEGAWLNAECGLCGGTGSVQYETAPIHFRKSRRAQSVDDHETLVEDGVSNTLNCFDVGDVRAVDVVAQPVAIGLDEEQNACVEGFGTLKARMEGGGFEGSVMTPAMQVRRLTPTECERLQGFPDGYTAIPWRKKFEAPDGPRYKALGNSMAVPCMAWIGKRIAEVDRGD